MRHFTLSIVLLLSLVVSASVALAATAPRRDAPFGIQVLDEETGRPVPLVQLETTSRVRFYTDSGGWVAVDDPAMMNQRIFFNVATFGYEFAPDGFGIRGTALDVKPGGSATLKIKRLNVAERLYRTTGEGTWRDTVMLGRKAPIDKPLLNAQITGQDSIQSCVYRGKIYFFWGDTGKQSYPLGLFKMAGATADLPGKGGLDPSVGINLKYFEDEKGFARAMVPRAEPNPVWADGFMVLNDDQGEERMVAHASLQQGLERRLERYFILFDDQAQTFHKSGDIPVDAPLAPGGHPFRVKTDGREFFYFPVPYPAVRVPAEWSAVRDLSQYEGFTPLKPGTRYSKQNPPLERDEKGKLHYAWKKDTPPLSSRELQELVEGGHAKRDELPFRLESADDGKPILLHGCSVAWNDYRQKWIMIALEGMGESFLGEVWFAEASEPEGPWSAAKKVATHVMETGVALGTTAVKMDLYNPKHHPFLDQENGRIIYFEGTYTHSFSGHPTPTPRYEYNQLTYRLDLSDPRLKFAD